MSDQDLEFVRECYQRWNVASRTGEFLPLIEEVCHPEIVLRPAGIFPDSKSEMHGHDGLLRFVTNQAEAFEDVSLEPEEFVEVAGRVVVPVTLRGHAKHSSLEVAVSFVHLWTIRDRKLTRLDVYATRADALAGLPRS